MRMPEFHKLKSNDFDEHNFIIGTRGAYHPYWFVKITIDALDDHNYIYGFISSSAYYNDAIVTSDDIKLSHKINKGGDEVLKRSEVKKAYAQVCRQLKERYKQWFKENM